MPNYTPNPFHMQTPIGQAAQNAIGMFLQAKLMEGQRADQQAQLALKQREFDEVTLPMKQAQMGKFQAEADKDAAAAAQMKNMPGVIAQAMTQLPITQIDQIRGYQKTGEWGRDPYRMDTMPGEDTIAGLFNLAQRPDFATPETMQRLSDADFISAAGANAEHMAKAKGLLGDQNFEQDAIAGLFTPQQMTARVQANYKGAPYSSPNGLGQVGNLVTGEASIDTPQARSKIASDSAYQAKQYSGVALDKANVGKVNAQTVNERAGGGGSAGTKGAMTQAQLAAIKKDDDKIEAAREIIRGYKRNGKNLGDMDIKKLSAIAMLQKQGVADTDHQKWVDYLTGGYEDKDAWAARSQQPAQGAKARPSVNISNW